MPASPEPTHYMLIIFAKPEAKCLTDLLKEIGGFFFSFCFNVSFRHSCQIFPAWLRCYLLLDRRDTTRLGAIHFSKRVSSISIKRTVACWNARDYSKSLLVPSHLVYILSQCFSTRISCVFYVIIVIMLIIIILSTILNYYSQLLFICINLCLWCRMKTVIWSFFFKYKHWHFTEILPSFN